MLFRSGTNPAGSGAIRLPTGSTIFARNSTNTADAVLIRYGPPYGADAVSVGDNSYSTVINSASLIYLRCTNTTAAQIAYNGVDFSCITNNLLDFGTAALRWRTAYLGTSLNISGATSGAVTVKAQAAAGTWTLQLPNSAGTSGQVLSTDGTGITSWVTGGGGGASDPLVLTQYVSIGTNPASTG